jgi:diguanylate cyclase (GGDEF)-like protein
LSRAVRHAVPALLLGVVYVALYLFVETGSAFGSTIGAAFWPQSGVTVAALLLSDRRRWPLMLAVVFTAEFGMDLRADYTAQTSAAMALANTVEPLVAALLLGRLWTGPPDLTRRDGILAFVVCAVVAGPAVGASIGTFGAALVDGDPIMPRLPRWFVGDAVGALVVAPAILALASRGLRPPRRDAAVPLAALLGVAVVVVGPFEWPADIGLPFLVIPALAFVAIRVGHVDAMLGLLLVAFVVETAAVVGEGPFSHEGPFGGLIVVQMFLAMASLTTLAIGVVVRDVVTRDALAASLRAEALHDSLTGLANRRLLFDRIDQARRRLSRRPGLVALIYVDLDRFKAVNDRWGHVAGDHVLRRTAQRLEGAVRDGDTVARIGGDEFVVLVEGLESADDVDVLAERIVAACSAPIAWRGDVLDVGASVGVAVGDGAVGDADAFLGTADRAMYAAKSAGGRRRVIAHAPAPGAPGR